VAVRGLQKVSSPRSLLTRLLGKKRVDVTREQALEARPLRNLEVKQTSNEEGEAVLLLERRKDLTGRVVGFVIAAPLSRRLVLDEMGNFVWQQCDGDKSVREIASLLARRYKLNPREAIISLTTFLRTLGKRGLIGFAVVKENENGSSAI